MAHDTAVIREIVTDLDRIIGAVQRITDRTSDKRELALSIVKLQEGRFWLQEHGHGGHFDSPAPEQTDAPAAN